MLGRCFGETDRGLPAAPSGCLGWIFLPLETSSRNLLMEFHRTVVKVTLDWFRNVSRCVFRGIPQRVYRGFKRMCSWGWRSHFRVVIGGWLCLLETLLLGVLKWGLKGVLKETLGRVSRTQRGVRRMPERGSGEGIFLPQSAFSKWNMRKMPIFRAWKSPVLPRNSAVFGRKWSSSATIHSESDCSHI